MYRIGQQVLIRGTFRQSCVGDQQSSHAVVSIGDSKHFLVELSSIVIEDGNGNNSQCDDSQASSGQDLPQGPDEDTPSSDAGQPGQDNQAEPELCSRCFEQPAHEGGLCWQCLDG